MHRHLQNKNLCKIVNIRMVYNPTKLQNIVLEETKESLKDDDLGIGC